MTPALRGAVWTALVLCLAVAVLVRPLEGNPYFAGSGSYAALVRMRGAAGAGEVAPLHAPYTVLERSVGGLVAGPDGLLWARLVPILSGLAVLALLWGVLGALNRPMDERMLAVVLLALDPAFLFSMGAFQLRLAAAALALGAVWAARRGRTWLAAALVGLVPFWGWLEWVGAVVAVGLAAPRHAAPRLGAFVAGGALVQLALFHPQVGLPPAVGLAAASLVELGGVDGLSVFRLALFLIGLALAWQARRPALYLAVVAAVGAAVLLPAFRALLAPVVATFGAHAVVWLARRRWQVGALQAWTLLLLGCAVLFGALSGVAALARAPPGAALVDALSYLHNSLPGERVLTEPENAAFVEFFTPRTATRHETPRPADLSDAEQRALYGLRVIDERTTTQLASAQVGYVLVTPAMRQGRVWRSERDGLLFLMSNSERFVLLSGQGGVELWQYLGPRQDR